MNRQRLLMDCPPISRLRWSEYFKVAPSRRSATVAAGMPAPTNERQRLEQERAELPDQIAATIAALAATPLSHKARQERPMWQIRLDEKRLADVGARLATLPPAQV